MEETTVRNSRLLTFVDGLTLARVLKLSLGAGLVVGLLTYLLAPRQYTARTTVLFSQRPDPIQSLGLNPASGAVGGLPQVSFGPANAPLEGVSREVIASRTVRGHLVAKYRLVDYLHVETEDKAINWLGDHTEVTALQKGLTGSVGLKIMVTCEGPPPLLRWLGVSAPDATDTAKRLAADLANSYPVEFNDYTTMNTTGAASEMRRFIEKRMTQVEANLKAAEDKLQQFRSQHQLIEPASQATQLGQQAAALAEEVANCETEIRDKTQSLNSSRRELSGQEARQIQEQVQARNPTITSLDSQVAALRLQMATALAEGKKREHPDVVALQSAIDEGLQQLGKVRGEVLQQVTSSINPVHQGLVREVIDLEVSLAGLRARKSARVAQLARARQALASLPAVTRQYGELERERAVLTELATTLRRRLEVAVIEEAQEQTGKLQVLDPATPPRKQAGPSSAGRALSAFVICLALFGGAWAYRQGLLAGESPEPLSPGNG